MTKDQNSQMSELCAEPPMENYPNMIQSNFEVDQTKWTVEKK